MITDYNKTVKDINKLIIRRDKKIKEWSERNEAS